MRKAAYGRLLGSRRGVPSNGDILSRTANEEGRLGALTLPTGRCSLPAESQLSRTSSENVDTSAGAWGLAAILILEVLISYAILSSMIALQRRKRRLPSQFDAC